MPTRKLAVLLIALCIALMFGTGFVVSASDPRSTVQAFATNFPGTATALKRQISGTTTQYANAIHATATAFNQKANATLTAFAGKVDSTMVAAQTNVRATVTALAGTATALRGTLGASGTAIIGTLKAIETKYSITPIPGEEAKVALGSYAESVLGVSSTFTQAVGFSGTFNGNLPRQIVTAQQVSANLALTTYYGKTMSSEAWLSYGSGTVTASVPVDVQNASLGVWNTTVSGTAPTTANAALALAKATYPNLAGLTYTPVTVESGFGFYSSAPTYSVDVKTGQLTLNAQATFLYTRSSANGVQVVAAVGRGDYAAALKPN